MTVLWTRDAAVEATQGKPIGPDWSATGVTIDSRKIAAGDLFVALPGERVDGHDYVAAALKAGAAAALVSRIPEGLDDAPLLVVEDVLAGLEDLARAARARSRARIVAVTGSVGKTGTKEMLAACLAVYGKTVASVGNLNNHIGAPLSLARLPQDCDFAVFELGMNHADEIRPLTRLVAPHATIITNVEPVHIEFFDGIDGIADAKAEILEGLQPGGVAVLNADNGSFERIRARARVLGVDRIATFGQGATCDVRGIAIEPGSDGTRVTAAVAGTDMTWTVGGIGEHWGFNSLGVVAVLHALKLDLAACLDRLATVSAMRGRGGQITLGTADGGSALLIDESYNASPPAVRAALSVFANTPASRRILVLGDMRELGATAPAAHAGLKDAVEAARPDAIYLCGDAMAHLRDALGRDRVTEWTETADALAAAVAANVKDGDVVLIKGSLAMGMKAIVSAVEAAGSPAPRLQAGGR
ncbi:UDP-N-acetylmuramoyl-tripeptide--D-alanyl-D-alanine ligase [Thalassobaculum sp. OXR-137]|uniref:UDP-N-acetylmuramoyl-tripeptide--D-alanyl-D- alanine ligase n=1 Tax=Thalassobaculum sp. OXR-137 TaxID=3100173 RepID=UPI002AC8FDF1|nr:UDP-N-acetylmuramoyl-tripeptide--D-alanyl-D-alanine ligase [Thalassobaculum sp. OXR-137]WPZ32163.1 UDP-N-acetylmuramoyl-tripeptide--D-alanyl-D-alanine ligase [Thalassobaculum sp. OXR-137]